ncbi:hypothetical protein LXL04_015733 [Taraxacum kok-saghyz]
MDKLKGSWYRSMKAFGIFCGSPIIEAAPRVRNVSHSARIKHVKTQEEKNKFCGAVSVLRCGCGFGCGSVFAVAVFATNKKTTEHYGTNQGTSFSLPISNGHIVGFTGNYGDFLDSFGYVIGKTSGKRKAGMTDSWEMNAKFQNITLWNHDNLPSKEDPFFACFSLASGDVEVGPWGGKGGYNPFSHRPEGRISEIRLRTGGCVDSIRITRTDASRTKHHSETYGGDGGSAHTITFADDEYLIGISGTVGTYVGITVITSLSFQTNKKTTEHYGTNQGTSFSLPISKGHIVGFTGNYGDFLDSFGPM